MDWFSIVWGRIVVVLVLVGTSFGGVAKFTSKHVLRPSVKVVKVVGKDAGKVVLKSGKATKKALW